MRVSSNIIGVCQVQKKNKERKEVKRKKKKEKRWEEIHISRVVKVRSLNLDLDLLWKDFGVKLGEIIEYYNTLLFKISREKDLFYESYEFLKILCQIWVFGHISFVWAFLDLQLWDLIDHEGLYMWQKFQVIWICIERDSSI